LAIKKLKVEEKSPKRNCGKSETSFPPVRQNHLRFDEFDVQARKSREKAGGKKSDQMKET